MYKKSGWAKHYFVALLMRTYTILKQANIFDYINFK